MSKLAKSGDEVLDPSHRPTLKSFRAVDPERQQRPTLRSMIPIPPEARGPATADELRAALLTLADSVEALGGDASAARALLNR